MNKAREAGSPARKIAALVAALAFMVAQGLFGAQSAFAQPIDAPDRLKLDVSQLSPRMITPTDQTVRLSATVTNVGDRPITDVVARFQVGAPLSTESEVDQALTEPPATDAAASQWVGVTDTLAPGQQASFSITVSAAELALTAPGLYPALLNVNGTPAYGGPARLAEVDLLLPVIDPPSGSAPTDVSVLWPISSSRPSVVAAPYGGPIVLSDDGLAEELAPGGRLDALVAAASAKRSDAALFGSLCFAVDPELLDTVSAMAGGYQVQTGTGRVDGSGGADAARWLESLRELVAGHCVVQIPYADADLSTLSKVETEADLVGDALNTASILGVLNVQPRAGVVWPGGALDNMAMRAATAAGARTLITDPSQLETANTGSATTVIDGTGAKALTYDPLVARALGGGPSRASEPSSPSTPPGQPNMATQNAIATLAFRGGLGAEQPSGPVLVAPPHGWDAPVSELVTMLDAIDSLNRAGMTKPAPLAELLAAPMEGSAALSAGSDTVNPPASATNRFVGELSSAEEIAANLQSAMSVDATRQVEPMTVIRPLHNAVLRATSTAWQSSEELSRKAAATATAQVDALRRQVTVATPSQPISLASGSSPLPVTLSNSLPVAVTVRIQLENSAGLRPARIPDTPLAAGSKYARLIPTEALRSGRFNVDVSLTTPDGTRLGSTARLELTSNEFGIVTVVLTASAAGALVLLSGHRLYRRVKARKSNGA
ncbi:hypothetical protein SAMN05421630_106396 [Prauserella marina]|uniref:Uncharacterized protein n=1 Tax=Prauserella marina TaxID=530584 RepID=A0A1G6SVK9_9PSEU|nr:DUF6049 family protein [Prauserella marina]PWV82160.1 hypothetical protein DES30_102396 [Prauserella marina]SDD20594.1 hypothetical protein SAMN05421630_106396 [Prauserella marina]